MKWISTRDGLPPYGEYVLLYLVHFKGWYGWFEGVRLRDRGKDKWAYLHNGWEDAYQDEIEVTHWMAISDPEDLKKPTFEEVLP